MVVRLKLKQRGIKMKQVKLNQFEAGLILHILLEVDRRDTFKDRPISGLVHYENCTRNMILTLTQLIEESQKKPSRKVA